jgi:hypothetical protein
MNHGLYRYTDFQKAWDRYVRQLRTHWQTLRPVKRDEQGKPVEWELKCSSMRKIGEIVV